MIDFADFSRLSNEYKQGKSFDDILERFRTIYGKKAIDKKTIKA